MRRHFFFTLSYNHVLLGIVLLAFSLFLGCAKQGYPTGGPKDVDAPKVMKVSPPNESVQFVGNQFFIGFDEYVVLKDASNNVLVSPPMDPKPEFLPKGHGLLVKLRDTLQSNTTYLFQFKEAIADFNEGNLLPSFEYVLSTGSAIDSMQLRGQIVDALTLLPRKEVVTVLLFDPRIDLTLLSLSDSLAKAKNSLDIPLAPLYQTRANKKGFFQFNYIKPGSYCLLALEDGNKNFRLEQSEPFAFYDNLVKAEPMVLQPNDSIAAISGRYITEDTTTVIATANMLKMSEPKDTKQRVTNTEFLQKGRAFITTHLPMQEPDLKSLGDEIYWKLSASRDTIHLWTRREQMDSLRLVLYDATGIQDTMKIRYRAPKAKAKPYGVQSNIKITNNFSSSFAYFDTLKLYFEVPVMMKDPNASAAAVCLSADSTLHDTVVITLKEHEINNFSGATTAYMNWQPKAGEKYTITLLPNVFQDIYGHTNDSAVWKTEVTTAEKYGILSLKLSHGADIENCMIELLDEKGNTLQRRPGQEVMRFEHLKAGKYRIRAFVDANHNGKWDAGDFQNQQQPEAVYYFEKVLDIRENWEFEERWSF